MTEKDYRLLLRDFVPITGWSDYRRRTGAPFIEDQSVKYREVLLATYNAALVLGTLFAVAGLESLMNK